MTIAEIKTVCFVGAGTMGCFNALVAAIAGYDAVIFDISAENLKLVPQKQQEMAGFLVAVGYFPADAIAPALQKVSVSSDLKAATTNADLVSESVFERLDLKREIHQQLDEMCGPETILTTNSSALLVSDIEDAVQRGDRFAALHSHLGAPLVDIVGGPRTSAKTVEILKRYVLSTNGIPLVLEKENPGYVLNALLGSLLTTAMVLVIDGLSTVEDVDRAWMNNRAAPMGPFGMMDLFGIDVVFDSWQQEKKDPTVEALKPKIVPFLKPKVDGGELGMKTGRGFYAYPSPIYGQPEFGESGGDTSLPHFAMTTVLLQNAVLLAVKGVTTPQEIDRAWMAATKLNIGPFGIIDEMGVGEFLATLNLSANLSPREIVQPVSAYLQPYVDRQEEGVKNDKGFYSYPDPQYKQPDFLRGA